MHINKKVQAYMTYEEYKDVGYFSVGDYTVNYTFIIESDNNTGVYNLTAGFNLELDTDSISKFKPNTKFYIKKVYNNIYSITYNEDGLATLDAAKSLKKILIHKLANILTEDK